MVLFTASRGNTFVGGTCALPSALLVLLAINYTGVQPHTVKLWTMDARRRVGCPFHQMGWVLGWGHADSWNFDIFWKFEMACFGASCVAFFCENMQDISTKVGHRYIIADHHHHHYHHHNNNNIIIIIIINLLAQKHDRVTCAINKASGTARTLMPLIAALEKYK